MKPPRSTRGKFFEEFTVGDEFISSARTVTETDIVLFAAISGDHNIDHTDEEFSKAHSIYGTRVCHGLIGTVFAEGLNFRLGIFDGTLLSVAERSWRFSKPLFPGDTVHVVTQVVSKEEEKSQVQIKVAMYNQHGEVIGESNQGMIMRKMTDAGVKEAAI